MLAAPELECMEAKETVEQHSTVAAVEIQHLESLEQHSNGAVARKLLALRLEEEDCEEIAEAVQAWKAFEECLVPELRLSRLCEVVPVALCIQIHLEELASAPAVAVVAVAACWQIAWWRISHVFYCL